MPNCQKVSMARGQSYPRTCARCGFLGPCREGYPNWYAPAVGEELPADPSAMPRERPDNWEPPKAEEPFVAPAALEPVAEKPKAKKKAKRPVKDVDA